VSFSHFHRHTYTVFIPNAQGHFASTRSTERKSNLIDIPAGERISLFGKTADIHQHSFPRLALIEGEGNLLSPALSSTSVWRRVSWNGVHGLNKYSLVVFTDIHLY
jgi:hypothetical protein